MLGIAGRKIVLGIAGRNSRLGVAGQGLGVMDGLGITAWLVAEVC